MREVFPMTREEALAIIEESRATYPYGLTSSFLLNALANWNSLFSRDRMDSLKWEGEGGELGLYDVLGKRVEHEDLVDRYRLDLAVAMTMMLSQIREPEQIVMCAFAVEAAVDAVLGRKHLNRPLSVIVVQEET